MANGVQKFLANAQQSIAKTDRDISGVTADIKQHITGSVPVERQKDDQGKLLPGQHEAVLGKGVGSDHVTIQHNVGIGTKDTTGINIDKGNLEIGIVKKDNNQIEILVGSNPINGNSTYARKAIEVATTAMKHGKVTSAEFEQVEELAIKAATTPSPLPQLAENKPTAKGGRS